MSLCHQESEDGKTSFVKIHAPWEVLATYADVLKIKVPFKVNDIPDNREMPMNWLSTPFRLPEQIMHPEPDYFTAPFDKSKSDFFLIDDRETFFPPSTRNRIVRTRWLWRSYLVSDLQIKTFPWFSDHAVLCVCFVLVWKGLLKQLHLKFFRLCLLRRIERLLKRYLMILFSSRQFLWTTKYVVIFLFLPRSSTSWPAARTQEMNWEIKTRRESRGYSTMAPTPLPSPCMTWASFGDILHFLNVHCFPTITSWHIECGHELMRWLKTWIHGNLDSHFLSFRIDSQILKIDF